MTSSNLLNRLYDRLIMRRVRWMMTRLADRMAVLNESEKRAVLTQCVLIVIGFLTAIIGFIINAIVLIPAFLNLAGNRYSFSLTPTNSITPNILVPTHVTLILITLVVEIQCIHGYQAQIMVVPRLPRRFRITRRATARLVAIIYGVIWFVIVFGFIAMISNTFAQSVFVQ